MRAARRSGWVTGLSLCVCAIAGASSLWSRAEDEGQTRARRAPPAASERPRAARALPTLPSLSSAASVSEIASVSKIASVSNVPRLRERPNPTSGLRALEGETSPVPRVPDPPQAPADPEAAPDDARDFDLPAEPVQRALWSPPL